MTMICDSSAFVITQNLVIPLLMIQHLAQLFLPKDLSDSTLSLPYHLVKFSLSSDSLSLVFLSLY